MVPGQRLVYDWKPDDDPGDNAGRASRVTFELTELGTVTGLHVRHDHLAEDEDLVQAVASGWPRTLSSLKSLLENGEPLTFGLST